MILEVQSAHPTAVVRFEATGNLDGAWDSDRLIQALSNLLRNAIQHGDARPVELTARGDAECVVVAVHNWGDAAPAPPP